MGAGGGVLVMGVIDVGNVCVDGCDHAFEMEKRTFQNALQCNNVQVPDLIML